MIGSIKGKLVLETNKFVIIDTNGVGYKINVSPDTISKISTLAKSKEADNSVFLWTHLHVREDAMDLYGFWEIKELEFFEMLISVSGIGPRGALTILGVASIKTLKKAISASDTSYLTKISGIGRKTAEKIIIELRDKMGEEETGTSLQGELDALEALKSLGYSQNEAREALKKISGEMDINTKIKKALKFLGKK
ncbi:MAG: Holliday junction branch migration protein RuvA [Patescibacteria group bacterium]